jgi:hypothetical protein
VEKKRLSRRRNRYEDPDVFDCRFEPTDRFWQIAVCDYALIVEPLADQAQRCTVNCIHRFKYMSQRDVNAMRKSWGEGVAGRAIRSGSVAECTQKRPNM